MKFEEPVMTLRQAWADLPKQKPNIVIVLVDDLGFSDLGYHGGEIETPHLDSLARGFEGLALSGPETINVYRSRVQLAKLEMTGTTLELEVAAEPGVSYTIEFVGTRRSRSLAGTAAPAPPPESPGRMSLAYSDGIGEVLRKVEGSSARYELTGDEIYVRARVISSRLHPNPFAEGDREMAWTQPLVPQR
jgi:hypothetical protein